MEVREYQKVLLDHSLTDNYIVVLPTGAGKTLIATCLLLEALERHPSKVAIFLTPTVALCLQQAERVRLDAQLLKRKVKIVTSYHSKTTNWKTQSLQKTILFATPQKFLNEILLSDDTVDWKAERDKRREETKKRFLEKRAQQEQRNQEENKKKEQNLKVIGIKTQAKGKQKELLKGLDSEDIYPIKNEFDSGDDFEEDELNENFIHESENNEDKNDDAARINFISTDQESSIPQNQKKYLDNVEEKEEEKKEEKEKEREEMEDDEIEQEGTSRYQHKRKGKYYQKGKFNKKNQYKKQDKPNKRNDPSSRLSWERCSLLIMDECHHAMKDHPYRRIMELYNKSSKKPKFLGLTASPGAAAGSGNVEGRIKRLCRNLSSKIATISKNSPYYEDLRNAVNIPEVQILNVFEEEGNVFRELKNLIECRAQKELKAAFEKQDKKMIAANGELLNQYHPLSEILEYFKTSTKEDEVNIFNFFMASISLSSFGALSALAHLVFITPMDDETLGFIENLKELQKQYPPKLLHLWDVLKAEYQKRPTSHKGIIFVETRKMAKDLVDLIEGHEDELISGKFSASTFLGHTNRKDGIRMLPSTQREILKKFTEGSFNLLVSTSVAEEGIDIPTCSYVIRFNAQMTPINMIQSRGRARYKDSQYYVLCSGEKDQEYVREALAAEDEMYYTLENMGERSLDWYTCQTTWEDQDPTRLQNFENKRPSLYDRHPAFKVFDFKTILSNYAQERWPNKNVITYSSTIVNKHLHSPLWISRLTINSEYFFDGIVANKVIESEQWAAFEACCQLDIVDYPK